MRSTIRDLIRCRRAIATVRAMAEFNQHLAESRLIYVRKAGRDNEIPVQEDRRARALEAIALLDELHKQNEGTLRAAMGCLGNWIEHVPPIPQRGLSRQGLKVLAWCADQSPALVRQAGGPGEAMILTAGPDGSAGSDSPTLTAHVGIVDDLLGRKFLAATERDGSALRVTELGWIRLYQEGATNAQTTPDAS